MGNYLLCKRPAAAEPLYIENIHLRLYSMEELCFFLQTNLALADEVLENPALSSWLAQECGLKNQMREYQALTQEEGKLSARLNWIFAKSHYFSENELRHLRQEAEKLDAMPAAELQKQKGDALFRFGKYRRCIACYKAVFETEGVKEAEAAFRAAVYHNMGCAYMRLFERTSALECFEKAREQEDAPLYRQACARAACFDAAAPGRETPEGTYSEEEEEARRQIAGISALPMPEDPDAALQEWVSAYHMSTDQ